MSPFGYFRVSKPDPSLPIAAIVGVHKKVAEEIDQVFLT